MKASIGTLAALLALASPAFATPGSGFAPSGIVTGHFGTIGVNTAGDKTDKWGMILKTLDDSDIGADRLTVAPGGYSGWHAHPAPTFVTVTQGSIVWSSIDPLCKSATYSAGESFIEPAYVVHNVRNASNSAGAEFIATHINPTGTSGPAYRLDRAEPTNCAF